MTNGERYKSAHDRAEAFARFCESHDLSCSGCPLDCTGGHRCESVLNWLNLESEESNDNADR